MVCLFARVSESALAPSIHTLPSLPQLVYAMAPKTTGRKVRHLPEAAERFASIRERRVEAQGVMKKLRAELKQAPSEGCSVHVPCVRWRLCGGPLPTRCM